MNDYVILKLFLRACVVVMCKLISCYKHTFVNAFINVVMWTHTNS